MAQTWINLAPKDKKEYQACVIVGEYPHLIAIDTGQVRFVFRLSDEGTLEQIN